MKKRASLGDYWPIFEFISIASVSLTLALIDVRMWLLIVLLPQLHGLHWLLASNYLQHAGAEPGTGEDAATDGSLNFSRNFTGWMNLIWFNIGFHTAHHENGKIHWFDLRQKHEEYVEKVPDWLIVNSLTLYFIRVLVFRRGRNRNDVLEH